MPGILHFSEASSLALHTILHVAERPGTLVPAREIARLLEASEAHLQKVLRRLVKAGILASTRGPRGGFRLARPAGGITLLDVYEAVEGPLAVSACLFDSPRCDGSRCIFGGFVRDVTTRIRDYLAGVNLGDHLKGKGQ